MRARLLNATFRVGKAVLTRVTVTYSPKVNVTRHSAFMPMLRNCFVFVLASYRRSFLQRRRGLVCYMQTPQPSDLPISRLPKALFRVLVGYTDREASHHQTVTHRLFQATLRSLILLKLREGEGTDVPRVRGPSHFFSKKTDLRLQRTPGMLCSFLFTNSERNETPMRLPRELRIVPEDDYTASVGSYQRHREGRQGSREKPDRPVWWNAQRCYKAHPYWTSNLKYAC